MNKLQKIIKDYVDIRSKIVNNHNGYAKIGCVAFSSNLTNQCVLCVWL